jgi:uncharacterized protein (DUF779 family)
METSRLNATEKALELIRELKSTHGDLMFYQAGGCCEDVMIGLIEDSEFWIDRDLFEYWKFSHFTLDVLDGFGVGGFSLETPLGKTFKIHYRLFTEDELANLPPEKRME